MLFPALAAGWAGLRKLQVTLLGTTSRTALSSALGRRQPKLGGLTDGSDGVEADSQLSAKAQIIPRHHDFNSSLTLDVGSSVTCRRSLSPHSGWTGPGARPATTVPPTSFYRDHKVFVRRPRPHDVWLRGIRVRRPWIVFHRFGRQGRRPSHVIRSDPVIVGLLFRGIRVGVAGTSIPLQHVHEANLGRRRLVAHPSMGPLHGVLIHAHRSTTRVHAGELAGTLPDGAHASIFVHGDDSRILSYVLGSSGCRFGDVLRVALVRQRNCSPSLSTERPLRSP